MRVFSTTTSGAAILSTFVSLAITLLNIPAHASPVFTLRGLGDLDGGICFSSAYDVNNRRQVAGYSDSPLDEGFFWTERSGLTALGDLDNLDGANPRSIVWGINERGQLAGGADGPNGREAFLWTESTGMQGLGELPGGDTTSRARDNRSAGVCLGGGHRHTPHLRTDHHLRDQVVER